MIKEKNIVLSIDDIKILIKELNQKWKNHYMF